MADTSETPKPTGEHADDAVDRLAAAATPSPPGLLRTPSPRVTAALAAGMLAIGVAVGAAIGPTPSTSLAGTSRLPLLLGSLIAGAGQAAKPAAPLAVAPQPTPAPRRSLAGAITAPAAPASTAAPPPTAATRPQEAAPSSPASGREQPMLPPITNVWLIELAGSSFGDALAHATAGPYIAGQAVSAGTLLSGWSALYGSALASDAALLASNPPQVLDTIVQPPCPEGAPQCVSGSPGALTAADSFLSQTLPTITANPVYRSSGLIVVTFGSVLSATATGLPAGAATAALTAQPPAGVLLLSPFAKAGARPATAFNPASPKQSLETLLHK